MCVQNFDDSRGFAIRITYRISLRSSSLWEPRHPLLKVVLVRFTQMNIGSRKRKELKSTTFSGYVLVLVIGLEKPFRLASVAGRSPFRPLRVLFCN